MWLLWLSMGAAAGGVAVWYGKERAQAAVLGTSAAVSKLRAVAQKLEDDLRGHR